MDMEWNQAMSSKSSIYNHLPIHLRGEIIQIGAVKLNDDWTPGEEFQIDVKPVYFRKMHYKVKKLTGIDSDRLADAPGFAEALAKFREFCGEDCTFLTWGCDDKGIMEQNIIVHDLDWDWITGWVNLQVISICKPRVTTTRKHCPPRWSISASSKPALPTMRSATLTTPHSFVPVWIWKAA
ncbi:MAG: exonuclease domain-containing protein [Ruminococcaceae bacterium]|nr:exonuclease domain-containing protein [Oscillospiraceae bacterium]